MIIYMAGCPGGVQKMPHRKLYDHVLFSKFVYLKRDFAWVMKRKEKELIRDAQKRKNPKPSKGRGKRRSTTSKDGGS